jgi:hypothetical protein
MYRHRRQRNWPADAGGRCSLHAIGYQHRLIVLLEGALPAMIIKAIRSARRRLRPSVEA